MRSPPPSTKKRLEQGAYPALIELLPWWRPAGTNARWFSLAEAPLHLADQLDVSAGQIQIRR